MPIDPDDAERRYRQTAGHLSLDFQIELLRQQELLLAYVAVLIPAARYGVELPAEKVATIEQNLEKAQAWLEQMYAEALGESSSTLVN